MRMSTSSLRTVHRLIMDRDKIEANDARQDGTVSSMDCYGEFTEILRTPDLGLKPLYLSE